MAQLSGYCKKSLQRGAGVIELALAIIILGIVAVFTLKGAAVIAQMRAFVTAQQIYQYQSAVLHYQNEFRALPGDDAVAASRWKRPEALFTTGGIPVSFSGDGQITGQLDDAANATGEQYMAWRDLRLAGLVEGDPMLMGQSAQPENTYGGLYGFAEENLGIKQALCLTRVPGRDAQLLDRRLDDESASTGRVRATSAWDPSERKNQFAAPEVGAYDPDKTYIVCLPNMP